MDKGLLHHFLTTSQEIRTITVFGLSSFAFFLIYLCN